MSPRGCCWPLWANGAAPTHQYCEAARTEGSSYCAVHRARSKITVLETRGTGFNFRRPTGVSLRMVVRP